MFYQIRQFFDDNIWYLVNSSIRLIEKRIIENLTYRNINSGKQLTRIDITDRIGNRNIHRN